MRACGLSTSMQESRELEKVQTFTVFENVFRVGKHDVHFSEKSCQPVQIHLIVADNSRERHRRSFAQVVEVILRDQGGFHVVLAAPTELCSVQNVALKLYQPNAAQAQSPERACRVQQIEM